MESGDIGLHRSVIGFGGGQHQLERVIVSAAIVEIAAADIVGGDLDQPVITAAAMDTVAAAAAGEHVLAFATTEQIIAGTAIELIIAFAAPAFEDVIALEPMMKSLPAPPVRTSSPRVPRIRGLLPMSSSPVQMHEGRRDRPAAGRL